MSVVPKNYELSFRPDLEKFTFSGSEAIDISCNNATSKIVLHCAELKINSCNISYNKKTIPTVTKLIKANEQLEIKFKEKIKGVAVIHLEFDGILNDRLLGFYRSVYKQNGKTKYMATTQFEAADARRAFPCWDEPNVKATFEISITADNKYTAISNMPVKSRKKIGNKTVYNFAKTPVVSTYLIYLGVGEFEYIAGKTGKTQIRVITTRGNKLKGRFALNLGKKLLKSYEEYFGIKYPLPKLDLIAIPDFAAGAMENWGAITFRETILLYDEKTSSTRTKQFIAEVISHEIAHQWFGNLVTMEWWNDLWLNESFATFMATKFVDKFYPEWELWDQFVEDAMNAAMSLDSLKSTHPIDVVVNSPAEIREIFDVISYDKGGCVLRMLEHHVGETNFQKGLKKYLSTFKYKNAKGQDLWNAIGAASKMPVTSMVKTWLAQPGFPLVTVTQDAQTLHLKQRRYLAEPDGKMHKGLWSIPLSIGLNDKFSRKLFSKKSMSLKLDKNALGFVVNLGRKGFYRTKYDEGILLDLKMLVDQKRIQAIDRWAIQNDLFSLCISGDHNIRDYLDFSDAYFDEDSYLVKINVAHNLTALYFKAFNENFASEIREHAIYYLRKILDDIGWDAKKSDKHTDALLRSFVISALGRMDDKETITHACKQYKKLLKHPNSVSPDLIEPICSIAAWSGGKKTHAELTRLYKTAKTMEEKLRFLSAMCGFKDEKLLIKSLDFSQTSSVRSQNMQLPIMRVAANPHGKKILWSWLKKNWKQLNNKVGHGNPLLNRIVASIALVADKSMNPEIKLFFKKNPTPGTERTQIQTLERIRINTKFLKLMRAEFKNG